MVSTRTSTSTITRQKYDVKTLELQGVTPSVPFSRVIRSPRKKTFKRRAGSSSTSTSKTTSPKSADFNVEELKDKLNKQEPEYISVDLNEGRPNVLPKTVFGEYDAVGKSKIQLADRKIEQWEEVKRAHTEHYPDVIPFIQSRLDLAQTERAKLEDNEENNRVGFEDLAGPRIAQRLKALEWALRTSQCTSERENISAVIEGYKSGAISYSKQLTIVYAGKIVDHATTYGAFLADRKERLDRYAAQYGPGWLFYEEPLDVHPESRPTMLRCATFSRETAWHDMSAWDIHEAFQKRTGLVSRMDDAPDNIVVPELNYFPQDPATGKWHAGSDGPSLVFRMLLDSGATYPSVTKQDLVNLGIDSKIYPCQAIATIDTASQLATQTRLYELFVQVVDQVGQSLVDPTNPVWPSQPKYIGGICPVLQLGDIAEPDGSGRETHRRLSGMLPFLACYVQVTPNRRELFLGEDRRHVLGGHRMPGQKRWDLAMIGLSHGNQYNWSNYDDPVTTFSHREGRLIDQDEADSHGSYTIAMKGTPQEVIVTNNPGREWAKRLAARAAAANAGQGP